MKEERKMKGITLITLVVTIIVLLILLGVTIGMLISGGVIDKAKLAKEEYERTRNDELNRLEEYYSSIKIAADDSSQITISVTDLNTLIEKKIQESSPSPTGTVISYMGNNAPSGYLTCDGTVYNISEYKNLAEQIKTEFGSYNYYGGDGETTFAVPDLRGEFLRGTGTHATSGHKGESVGIHQAATAVPYVLVYSQGSVYFKRFSTGVTNAPYNTDGIVTGTNALSSQLQLAQNVYTDASSAVTYTSRPTNTSVLYCIKY